MEKHVEANVETNDDQADFRNLLESEIMTVGGGDTIVGLY